MNVIFQTTKDGSGERGFNAKYSSNDQRICGGDFHILPTENEFDIIGLSNKSVTCIINNSTKIAYLSYIKTVEI